MSSSTIETTRRRLTPRQAETVDRLAVAALEELRTSGYDGLTIRNVAARAEVSAATAYTYFSSREHLVTELFWRRLVGMAEPSVDRRHSATNRATAVLSELALVAADEPELSTACTQAMLATDPEVALLRDRIGAEMHRRLVVALGEETDAAVFRALEVAISGALLQTGMGHLSYEQLPELLGEIAGLVIAGSAEADQNQHDQGSGTGSDGDTRRGSAA